jgi:hypothetical protein
MGEWAGEVWALLACRDMRVWMLSTRTSGQVKAQEGIDSRAARS